MVRSVTRDLPEQGKNNPAVNQAAGNGGQKMGQYSWFTVYHKPALFLYLFLKASLWKACEACPKNGHTGVNLTDLSGFTWNPAISGDSGKIQIP